ncbi:MAG: BTAD domain-containing putative transcriptional regulator [Streptosporangiaceae bacterium]|jgi:hypothetical protein
MTGDQLDLLTFRQLVADASAMRAAGDELTACDIYEQAMGLWRGDPLTDMDVLRDRPRVAELGRELAGMFLRYAEVACGLGLHDRVLPRLQSLAAAEPLDERVHARLMIALAGAGQQIAALRVYEDLRARLDREFAVYPSEELVDAHRRVLRQDFPIANSRWSYGQRPSTPILDYEIPRQLPAPARNFTGRIGERDVLSGLLDQASREADGVAIAVLTGMAGIGKTTLAVNWAHQVADRFPDGQLFVNLREFCPSGAPLTSTEALRGFLTALGVPPARIPADTGGRAALYRSTLARRRMLIVLDNATDTEQVRPLLPGSPGCLVLVTSRNRLTGLAAAEGADLLTLDVLSNGESYSLLVKILGAERVIAEPEAVSELIALCGGLPLALCAAAARVAASPDLPPLATLGAAMRDKRGQLDVLETGEAATSVRVGFSWSSVRVSEPAARMFQMLAVHPGPDITVPAAASLAGLDQAQAYLALAELRDGHLVTEHVCGRYMFSDLLRAYATEAAHTHISVAEQHAAVCRALEHYVRTASVASALLYPYLAQRKRDHPREGVLPERICDAGQAAEWFESERHVLLAAIRQAADGGYDPYAWELPWAAGLFFRGERNWRKLADAQETALEVADKLGDLTGQALARHHLGWLRFWLGEDTEACRHLVEGIALSRQLGDGRFHALAGLIRSRVLQAENPIPEALVQAGQRLRLYQTAGELPEPNAIVWQLTQLGAARLR